MSSPRRPIKETSATISKSTIQQGLKTNWIGETVIHKASVASTQHIAHDLAQQGAKSGTIIVADEQTAGRGRLNRKWQSKKHKGIWMSIILRPNIWPHLAPQLTLLTSAAIAETLETHTNVTPQIKWPNDILINDKKTVGILTEMHTEHNRIQYVIIGMGINVNHSQDDLNHDLTNQANSLFEATGKTWDITWLIRHILPVFEASYMTFLAQGFRPAKQQWERYAYKIHKNINIQTNGRKSQAIMRGIADDGALKVEIQGRIQEIHSGEIHLNS